MTETLPTIQWGVDVDEKSQLTPNTRGFFSNEVVRWDEPLPNLSRSLISASACANVISPSIPNTLHANQKAVQIPRVKRPSASFKENYILLKKYEGFVTSRGAKTFSARLYENNSDYPVMEAEFDLEELADADRDLVVDGAALVWTIGYHEEGSRKRESFIYMRRGLAWQKSEIEHATQAAQDLIRGLEWK